MLDKLKNNPLPKSYYFNFRDYFRNIERGQTPYTPAVTIMYELNDMLNLIDENGGKDVWINKVKEKAQYFRKRANELGLVVPDYPKSNTLTPIYFDDINALELVKLLQKKYELFVNPCGGELATKLLRVSHIGNTTLEDIDNLLDKIMLSIEEVEKGELVYDRQ
jgi:aspartate aminotransferase-like enzyme